MTTGVALAAAGTLPAAAAAAECPVQPTTQAFARFGDTNEYFLAPGGTFDAVWARDDGRPRLVPNLNPFNIGGGVTSLHLDDEESVTSDAFCVDRTMPHLRFVARSYDGDELDVTVRMYDNGRQVDAWTEDLPAGDYRSWAPSHMVALRTGALAAGESRTVTLEIGADDDASWLIDDVFIDPYRR